MSKRRFYSILILATVVILTVCLFGCLPTSGRITIKFDPMGGGYVAPIKIKVGENLPELPTPVRDGYVFDGWYTDSSLGSSVDLGSAPKEDCVYYAKWTVAEIPVAFASEGFPTMYVYVPYGTDLTADMMPPVPEKEGYFGRWGVTSIRNITARKTVYAVYESSIFTVRYLAANRVYAEYSGMAGEKIEFPSEPEIDGYYFYGWYKDAEYTEPLDEPVTAIGTTDTTVYARMISLENMARYFSVGSPVGGEVMISGLLYLGRQQSILVVPERIGNYPVVGIASGTAERPTIVTEQNLTIIIPEYVKTIGDYAFSGVNLKEVRLADGLEHIGDYAFSACGDLTSIKVPRTVKSVGDGAFSENPLLTEVVFEKNSLVETLGEGLFAGNDSLTEFTLPDNDIFRISYKTFAGGAIENYNSVKESGRVFTDDGVIYIHEPSGGYRLCRLPPQKGGSYRVLDGTVTIDEGAFNGNKNITDVTMPDSVVTIRSRAFHDCENLTTVILGRGVRTIEAEAFLNSGVTEIEFPAALTDLGESVFRESALIRVVFEDGDNKTPFVLPEYAFYECNLLRQVVLPQRIRELGNYSFYGCDALEGVDFGSKSELTKIGEYVFTYCNELQRVAIPTNVRYIGAHAFQGNENARVEPSIPDKTEYIGDYAFQNAKVISYAASTSADVRFGEGVFYNCKNLARVTLPRSAGFSSVPAYTFYGCTSIATVTFNANITKIEKFAFYGCTKLTTLTFNANGDNGIKEIEESAFEGCIKLDHGGSSSTILPNTLTKMGNRAFYGCTGLTHVSIPRHIQEIPKEAFAHCDSLADVLFLEGCETEILRDNCFAFCDSLTYFDFPSKFKFAEDNPFYGSDNLVRYGIADNDEFFAVDGIIYFNGGDIYLYPTGRKGEFVIGPNVTYIDDYAFHGTKGLTKLSFATNSRENGVERVVLVRIGPHAFEESGITTLELSYRVAEIEPYAFADSALSSVEIFDTTVIDGEGYTVADPRGGETNNRLIIGEYAFSGTRISELVLQKRVKRIDKGAFSDCYSLSEISFNEEYASGDRHFADETLVIGEYAFANNPLIRSIEIPSRVTVVGNHAFENCRNMESVLFVESDDGTLVLGDYAFASNHYLQNIHIPSDIISLGRGVFYDCTRLISVEFSETQRTGSLQISDYAFYGCMRLKEITFPNYVTRIGEGAFEDIPLETIGFEDNGALPLYIGERAFAGTAVTEMIFRSNLAELGAYAFLGSEIRTVVFEGDVRGATVLRSYAFASSKLENITLGDNVLVAGAGVFSDTKSLGDVIIAGEGVVIPESTFENSGIRSLTITGTTSEAGEGSFRETKNLLFVNLVVSGDFIVGDGAFENSGLSDLRFGGEARDVVIGEAAFRNSKFPVMYIHCDAAVIKNYAFAGSALETLSVNAEIKNPSDIGDGITYGAKRLASIEMTDAGGTFFSEDGILYERIPNGRTLKQYPAGKSGALFTVPADVIEIASYAFAGSAHLTTVTVPEADKTILFGEHVFDGAYSELIFYADADRLEDYSELNVNKEALQRYYRGFVLSGVGGGKYVVSGYTGTEKDIVIQGKLIADDGTECNIVRVAENAFMNNVDIETLRLDLGILRVEKYAFANATNLKEVYFGDNLGTINVHAFDGCTSLHKVVFGKALLGIDSYAFNGCSSLKKLDLSGTGLLRIGAYAFGNCDITDVKLSSTLQTIENNAFENNKNMVKITFPRTLASMSGYVFFGCENLVAVFMESDDVPAASNKYAFTGTTDSLRIFVSNFALKKFKASADFRYLSQKILSYDEISSYNPDYVLTENADGYTLTYYLGTEEDVTVLHELDDIRITEIGEYAFNHFVKRIVISDGVKRIARNAFRNAVELTSADIAESVESIGAYAFYGLTSLEHLVFGETASANEPANNKLKSIGAYAFYECAALGETETVRLPARLSEIGNYAFYGAKMDSLDFTAGIGTKLKVGAYAFAENDFERLTFDCVVESFGDGAFENCRRLSQIYLNSTGVAARVGDGVFRNCDLLCVYVPTEAVMRAYRGLWSAQTDKNRVVVRSFISEAEETNGYVISVSSGTKVASIISYIGDKTELVFPGSITIDGIAYTVSTIGRQENNDGQNVNGCVIGPNVTSIEIPTSVNTITGEAFRGAVALETVTFTADSNLAEIGSRAFADCPSLTTVRIPRSVTTVGSYVFANTPKLTTVTIEERSTYEPASSIEFNEHAFDGSGIAEITFPKHLTSLKDYAFANCKRLETVNFAPDGTASFLGEHCFDSAALSRISLPASMAKLDEYCFANCANLQSINLTRTIGAGVTSVTAAAPTVFAGISSPFVRIYVPETAYGMYKEAEGWREKTVIPDLSAVDSNGVSFNYRVNGNGAVVSSSSTLTLTAYLGDGDEIVIPRSLKIGEYNCTVTTVDAYFGNATVKKISFAKDSEISILNAYAFAGCTSLETLILTDRITTVEQYAFSGCTSLLNVTLSSVMREIPQYCFFECSSLREITVPASVKTINNAAFRRCTRLNRVNVMFNDASALGMSAFADVSESLVVIVPDGRSEAFKNQWSEIESRIFDSASRTGDYVVREVAGGYFLVQYNGSMTELKLSEITLRGKQIVEIGENALPNGTVIIKEEQNEEA